MAICKAPLTEGYWEALSPWQAGENKYRYTTAVLNLLRLEDHLKILFLGHVPPLKIEMPKLVRLCVYMLKK